MQQLQEAELAQFQAVIDMENPDLYKWLTGQADVPDEVENPLLRTLCKDLREQMVRARARPPALPVFAFHGPAT